MSATDAARRVVNRIGYRGLALTCLGVVWLGVGTRIITETGPSTLHKLPIEYLPIWLRVTIWWAPAVVAIVTAWVPTAPTRIGFIALVIPPVSRALSFLGAFFMSAIDRNLDFWSAALTEAVVWGGVTAYVIVVSAWPDPTGSRGDVAE